MVMSSSSINDKSTCRLCGRQFAKYNCPTCNVAYCSLTCFRSEAHTRCSEVFYKKEVETEIRLEPSKSPQERIKMMELLRNFEEQSQQNMDNNEEDDSDDLARRFEDIDIDAASSVNLWSKLTPAEQAEFLKIMEDPNSSHAQQLLASEELENERLEPWWAAPGVEVDNPYPSVGLKLASASPRFGPKPDIMHIPTAMMKSLPNGSHLIYNICAVCIAYSFVTRHLFVSPLSTLKPVDVDFEAAKHLIAQLVPFLVDRRSKIVYHSLPSLVTEVWSRFQPGQVDSALFSVLLQDTACLIRPLVVTMVSMASSLEKNFDATSHPHSRLVLGLSDLMTLFMGSKEGAMKTHIAHKLLFYAVHVLSTPTAILSALAEEVAELAVLYQQRAQDDSSANFPGSKDLMPANYQQPGNIEEI